MLPKVIDLFSGCGGLALGFEKVGFDIVAGIELKDDAINTISYNLAWRYGKEQTHLCYDITKMQGDIFKDKIGKEGCIVIGGPPCQAYSIVGRGKLRSLGEHRVNINDNRGYLYQDFIRFVLAMKARAVVMENVPESTNFGKVNIPQVVCEELEKNDYKAYWTILNAADFGTPQVRERVFVFGVRNDENVDIKLPLPTHRASSGNLTMYQRRFETFKKFSNFRVPNKSCDRNELWITVGEDLSELPTLFINEFSEYKSRPLNIELPYKTQIENNFQYIMRNWYGKSNKKVSGNAFRKNTRDFPIFSRMKQGDNYIDASRIADQMLLCEAKLYNYEKDSKEYKLLKRKMVPQYDREKFENKWKRLDANKPSHTVVAHLEKDTYSHIHPWEPRGISVREAARLQSFPDDFVFNCSMSNAFRQIGNAVPPLLSLAVAKTIYDSFKEE